VNQPFRQSLSPRLTHQPVDSEDRRLRRRSWKWQRGQSRTTTNPVQLQRRFGLQGPSAVRINIIRKEVLADPAGIEVQSDVSVTVSISPLSPADAPLKEVQPPTLPLDLPHHGLAFNRVMTTMVVAA